MSALGKDDLHLWNGSDREAFHSVHHPGYTTQSDPQTHTGGWLAHRHNVDLTNDWIQTDVAGLITKFDYNS
jgi:hypothetical protein